MRNHRSQGSAAPLRPAAAGLVAVLLLLSGCVVAPLPPRSHQAPPPPSARAAHPASAIAATPLYFYPQLSQSEDRQDRDRYECYRWASRETGFDPGMTPVREEPPMARTSPPAPPPHDGAAVIGGAAAGAVVGSVLSPYGRTGSGAALGAIFGAMIGAAAESQRHQVYEQARQRDDARESREARGRQPMANFRRAMTACMEGRGYTVR